MDEPAARARALRVISAVCVLIAQLAGWGALVAVLQKWSDEPADILGFGALITLLANVTAIALAIASLVSGRGKLSPALATALLVVGVLGLAGTAGLVLFFGLAAMGVK